MCMANQSRQYIIIRQNDKMNINHMNTESRESADASFHHNKINRINLHAWEKPLHQYVS